MHNHHSVSIILAALLLSGGCDAPNPEGRYDAFLDRTADMRAGEVELVAGQQIDFSGSFLLAASTVIGPGVPLYFQADVTVDLENSKLDMSIQPLTVDSNENPRTAVGPPIIIDDADYTEDGTFSVDLGRITVDGAANPLTGRDIVATLILSGSVVSADFFCGAADGDLHEPSEVPLAGSTFAAVLAEGGDMLSVSPIIYECPASDSGDSGDSDAGD